MFEQNSASAVKTPLPTLKFFHEQRTLSTKKARGAQSVCQPPRPPKTLPPVSRLFQNRTQGYKAKAVSFRSQDISIQNKHYDDTSKDLYFNQCFEVISRLGYGSFGEVFKVRSKVDGKMYAVKKSRERFRGEFDRKRKLEEVQKHEQLPPHPNCIRFIKAWEEKHNLYIQTELCQTSLSNLAEQNHDIPEYQVWNYLVDLLLALKHLHDHNLIHLDIKPDNIFISHDGICKLGDFGLVLDLTKVDESEAQDGDPKYLAPEVMNSRFTKAADVFSLGITILEIACDLDLPRGGEDWHDLRSGRLPPEFVQGISAELLDIITNMMNPVESMRPNIDQLLSLPCVCKVRRIRRWKHIWSSVVSTVWGRLFTVWFLMCSFFLLLRPFQRRLLPTPDRFLSPPPNISPQAHEFDDFSISDDEVFEDHSLAAPIFDTSSSSADSLKSNLRNRFLNTTPDTSRKSAFSLRTPRRSPDEFNSFRLSPRYTSSPSHDSSVLHDEPSLAIGPKNLMEVFESSAEYD